MAKDRIEPCKFYICAGYCEKQRDANHYGYCQKCDKYIPRKRIKYKNLKKIKLQKIKNKEFYWQ